MNKIITPNQAKPLTPLKHHSVSDWDKSINSVYYLDPGFYQSPPKSLRKGGAGSQNAQKLFLSRITTTLNLPQGQIATWLRSTDPSINLYFTFRNQSPLGTVAFTNQYEVRIASAVYQLVRVVAGEYTSIGFIPVATEEGIWRHDRITWWNGFTPDAEPALTFMLERYLFEEWIQQGNWLYDTTNQFKDSTINRCGIGSYEWTFFEAWFDDTEIWGPL